MEVEGGGTIPRPPLEGMIEGSVPGIRAVPGDPEMVRVLEGTDLPVVPREAEEEPLLEREGGEAGLLLPLVLSQLRPRLCASCKQSLCKVIVESRFCLGTIN